MKIDDQTDQNLQKPWDRIPHLQTEQLEQEMHAMAEQQEAHLKTMLWDGEIGTIRNLLSIEVVWLYKHRTRF